MGLTTSDGTTHLIGGSPCLLSRLLAAQILALEPHAEIRVLVDADDYSQFEAHFAELSAAVRGRIHAVVCHYLSMDWGLSGAEYQRLLREVRRVYFVLPTLPESTGKQAADRLGAALGRELLEFARGAHDMDALVCFSTARAGRSRSAPLLEGDVPREVDYSQTAHRSAVLAEQILRRADAEIPLVFLRAAVLAGEKETGEMDAESPLYELVASTLSLAGSAPNLGRMGRRPVYLVPTDVVARAGYYASRSAATRNRVFHLTPPHPISAQHLINRLLAACNTETGDTSSWRPIDSVAQASWRKAFERLVGSESYYDSSEGQKLLAECHVDLPELDEYIDRLVDFARSRRSS